jgi:hypothetical protein
MLSCITRKCLFRLFPLLVMGYIALGVPLTHPLLHDLSIEDHAGKHDCTHHRENKDDDSSFRCPICHFLLGSQWLATPIATGMQTNLPFGHLPFADLLLTTDTGPIPAEPRAPPTAIFSTRLIS